MKAILASRTQSATHFVQKSAKLIAIFYHRENTCPLSKHVKRRTQKIPEQDRRRAKTCEKAASKSPTS